MLATNHGIAGTIIGSVLPIPIAIPVAFLSHFVMDMLPHYGAQQKKRNTRLNKSIVYTDTIIALSIAILSAVYGKWDRFWIGWVAYSPDGYWVYMYFKNKRSLNMKPTNHFTKFHKKIQFERSWGIIVELIILSITFPLYFHYLLA